MHIKGKFIRKPLCYGSLEFLNSQWQRVTRTCALGLHEDKFWTTTHINGWMKNYMASVDDVGKDCRGIFGDS